MASKDLCVNEVHAPNFHSNGSVINGHTTKDQSRDARVHSCPVSGPEGIVTILLRHKGQFFKALLEPDAVDDSSLDEAKSLTVESLVRVTGSFANGTGLTNTTNDDIAVSVVTCHVKKLAVLSQAKPGPLHNLSLHGAPNEAVPPSHSRGALFEKRLDNRLLDARVASTAAIFKLFSGVHELAVDFLRKRDFYHVPTPALVNYEFPGEEDDLFSVPYFDRTARLAPTGEIHLGMALSADLERVYDCHTVFRREPASDGRHLTEFTMLEMVFNLKNDWTEILDLADNLLVSIIQSLQQLEKYITLTNTAHRLYPGAGTFQLGLDQNGKLFRVTFKEAKAILRNSLGLKSNDQDDFTREEEAALGRFLASSDTHLGKPTDVFILTHFPRHLRACNIYIAEEDETTTQSFDVILRGQECITGCRLLHSYQELHKAFTTRSHPIDPDSPEWRPYMEAHEIGMPPWGGFGLGINRLVQGFWGLTDIRETVLFPRDAARLIP
ncbi:hypothetical protein BD289DRAFT_368613 [Coniella lustricola]|uniref:Aminoacyl-transfer RNA synthetases class-II family profile domain-containing protein n=1 Tax=Coniella lustricola TaxID=2025994 RepID=A0A2T3A7T9_9PEZI|nr:hypothetical protein BD289DRAFT_368613 [Coniella lustricola]